MKLQWLWGTALRTSEADDLLGRMGWDCCPPVASSRGKPWRDRVAVDVQEMAVLRVLSWEKGRPAYGEDREVHEWWKMLKPSFSEASTLTK